MTELITVESSHAVLAPSSMKMFMACNASLLDLELRKGAVVSEYAEEGTLAHAYIEEVLTAPNSKAREKIIGTIPDTEMRGHVANFCHTVESVLSKIGLDNIIEFKVEERVRYSEHVYGTVDVLILYIRQGKKCAYILDFKYGKGVPVFAEYNEQLLTYLVAALKHFDFPAERGTIAIYQPRNSANATALDQWVVDGNSIKAYETKLNKFEKIALKIIDGTAKKLPLEAPGEHCQFCHRKPICIGYSDFATAPGLVMLNDAEPLPLLEQTAEITKTKTGKIKEIKIKPGRITDEQLDIILRQADLIGGWIKAVQKYAAGRFATGHPLQGWKLVEGRKTRKWIDNDNQVGRALEKMGMEEPYIMKLKGITEVEKELGIKGKELEGLTTYNTPKPKLVPEEDPRPAITNAIDLLGTLDSDEESEEQ